MAAKRRLLPEAIGLTPLRLRLRLRRRRRVDLRRQAPTRPVRLRDSPRLGQRFASPTRSWTQPSPQEETLHWEPH